MAQAIKSSNVKWRSSLYYSNDATRWSSCCQVHLSHVNYISVQKYNEYKLLPLLYYPRLVDMHVIRFVELLINTSICFFNVYVVRDTVVGRGHMGLCVLFN